MKPQQYVLILLLVTLALSSSAYSQTPSPTPSGISNSSGSANTNATPQSTITNQNASPSPSVIINTSAGSGQGPVVSPTTSVIIGPSGVQLSGFPAWIIWVLLASVVVFGLVYFLWIKPRFYSGRTAKSSKWVITLLSLALLFSIGIWLGSWLASRGLRQMIDSGTFSVTKSGTESAQNSIVTTNPSDQSPVTSTSSSSGSSLVAARDTSWIEAAPVGFGFIIALSFLLLAGLEFILYYHVTIRSRSPIYSTAPMMRWPVAPEIIRSISEKAYSIYRDASSDSDLEELALRISRAFQSYPIPPTRVYDLIEELRLLYGKMGSPSSLNQKVEELLYLLKNYNPTFWPYY